MLDDPEDVEKMLLHQEVGRGHRRVEMRTALVSHGIDRPQDFRNRYGQLTRLVRVQRRRQSRGRQQAKGAERSVCYFSMNKETLPECLLELTRNHWAIKNGLRWAL